MNGPYCILSFDGGGVRGAFAARLLARLADAYPELLYRTALFAGTSTGGLIALGLARGLGPNALVRLYRDHAGEIFQRRPLGGFFGAKYRPDGLRRIVADLFRDRTLGELERDVLVPTFDLDAPATDARPRSGKAKFFESRGDAGAMAFDVAMATSAAPTFFPAHKGYVDGGVVANNPAACAAAQARTWGVPREQLRVLSIGTGFSPSFIEGDDNDWGFLRWAPRVVPLVLDGVSGVADYQLRQLLGPQYFRLDGVLPREVELDDAGAVSDLVAWADRVDLSPAVRWLQQGGW